MVNISKFGDSAIKFKFTDNDHYLFNGEIEVPINSLLLVLDESDMVTFKKIDGDPFVSFLISNSNFASKNDLENFYKTSMVGSTGGGSESGITSGDVESMIEASLQDYYDIDEIDAALSGKADSSAVTEAINSAVSGKADTSAVTESINAAVSGKADTSSVYTKSEVDTALSGKADTSAVTEAINSAVSGKADTSAITTSITSASTDTQVPSAKAVYDSNPWFILQNPNNSQRGVVSKLAEYYDTNIGQQSYIFGSGNPWSGQPIMARGQYSYAFGLQTSAMTQGAVAEGRETLASNLFSHSEGEGVKATNIAEHSQGRYNVSNQASTTFGNSGNTLFSVGNGTSDSARHNAFEIRQNGDIYITKDGADVKLQEQLGGGSITIDPSLDSGSTNAVANSAITTAINAKENHLTNYIKTWNLKYNYDLHGHSVLYFTYRHNDSEVSGWFPFANINSKSVASGTDFSLIETSAITTSVTSSSTDSQVPSAKAVYDALQESGGGGVSESAFTAYSAATDARISEDEEVTAAALNALNDGKQDTLIAGSGITISGNVISAEGGNLVIELTQAEYDALVDKDPNAFYIITDATEINISDYYTSAQTQSAINAAVSGKQDTLIAGSGITISGNVISANGGGGSITVDTALDSGSTNPVENRVIYDKFDEVEEVTAAALNALNDELSTKQDTLVAGDNITISGNVISAIGGGGGKAINAGRGISVTTGETADTVSFNLPISASTNGYGIILHSGSTASTGAIASGNKSYAALNSIAFGLSSSTHCNSSIAVGEYNNIQKAGYGAFALGNNNIISTYGAGALGEYLISNASNEVSCGKHNISRGNNFNFGNSGDTLFTVGNGDTNSTRHNALEIRQNGDIYFPDTDNTTYQNFYEKPMVRLQDMYAALGGLKLVKLTQSAYDALSPNYDSNTLYVITD